MLGARTNRNGAIMDLMCNIAGKVPNVGLLTDAGRQACWHVRIADNQLPPPELLGVAIGRQVLSNVPYISGLAPLLAEASNAQIRDYIHELGAACATAGAVGLIHVEGITPEAIAVGRRLLNPEHEVLTIDRANLESLKKAYESFGEGGSLHPEKCYLGCPHLSLEQLRWWSNRIGQALAARKQQALKVKTTICAAPQVLAALQQEPDHWRALEACGVHFSSACPMQLFDRELSADDHVVTNSIKLRSYTSARYLSDTEILKVIVSGTCTANLF